MLKQLLLLVNMLGLLLFNVFFAEEVKIDMQAPGQVVAGEEMIVEVKLDKADYESFARFQQELPAGLVAEPINTANADFSFEDQKVRFIWLKLPFEEEIEISYKIFVDRRLKGTFNLNGKFSYIAENKRMSVDVVSTAVTISPSSTIDPSLIVDIDDFKNLVVPTQPANLHDNVICLRQKPYQNSDGEYIVNVLVNKANIEKYSKIQEMIPEGFEAEIIDNNEALFTFTDQIAKFLWETLPPDDRFVVSYKLIPEEGIEEEPAINGTFSYIKDQNTYSLDIIQMNADVSSASDKIIMDALATTIESSTMPQTYIQPGDYSGQVKIEIAEKAKKLLEQDNSTNLLEPENGIYYRVQIAAGHKPINIQRYFRKYNLDKVVRTEFHEGWRKYSVGSFSIYKAARDYREHIWNTTTIDDAFVSAYNDGKRITVQEALMATNQQWYK